jgi:hypothetical protein
MQISISIHPGMLECPDLHETAEKSPYRSQPAGIRNLRSGILLLAALLLGGLAAGCAASGVQMQESEFLRILERKSGLIAYLGMDGNIFTVNQAGEDPVQLTDDVGELPLELVFAYRMFAWSPRSCWPLPVLRQRNEHPGR